MPENALRAKPSQKKLAVQKTKFFDDVRQGLLPKPIKRGGRMSFWLESELDTIISARASGASDDDVRRLVRQLHEARSDALNVTLAANPRLKHLASQVTARGASARLK